MPPIDIFEPVCTMLPTPTICVLMHNISKTIDGVYFMFRSNHTLTATAITGCLLATVFAQDKALESESVFVETVGKTEVWNMKAK